MHDYESNPIPHQFDSKPKQENSTTQTPTPPPLLRELDLSEYQDLEAVDDLPDTTTVMIHDGARPLASKALISRMAVFDGLLEQAVARAMELDK